MTRVQDLALQAFNALDCAGMSRVDFFLKPDGDSGAGGNQYDSRIYARLHVSGAMASRRNKL